MFTPTSTEALSGYDIPDVYNYYITPYNDGCAKNPNKYWHASWVSPGGQPKSLGSVTVPYGTQVVSLDYNRMIFLCHEIVDVGSCKGGCPTYSSDGVPPGVFPTEGTPKATASLQNNHEYIHTAAVISGGGQLTNSPALKLSTISRNGSSRYWFNSPINFNYDATAPMTSSRTVVIRLVVSAVNSYPGGSYCVVNGAPAVGFFPPWGCPLQTIDFTIQVNVGATPYRATSSIIPTIPNNTVVQGKSYDVLANVSNSGPNLAPNVFLEIKNIADPSNGAQAIPIAPFRSNMHPGDPPGGYPPGSGDPPSNTASGFTPHPNLINYNYWSATPGGCDVAYLPCWGWVFSSLAGSGNNRQQSVSFKFKVPDGAPIGSKLCFLAVNKPQTPVVTFYEAQPPYCVTVEDPDKPFVSTENGDVHAGSRFASNPCFDPGASIGEIRGRLDAGKGSKATYAVSAGADINNFGSANESNLNNKLTFGNVLTTGQYGAICRQDIAAEKLADSSIPSAPTPIDQGQLDSFSGPFVKVSGDLTIGTGSSLLARKGDHLTIVVDGNVHIKNNITYETTNFTSIKDIPSFAIVAKRNIFIDPAVSQLDGVYSAGTKSLQDPGDGVIDTCRNGFGNGTSSDFSPLITVPGGASQCGSQLVVNGMLVAKEMYFRRTFGDIKTTQASDLIKLNGMLYLSPPPGFGQLTQQLRFSGDRPPVF